MWSMWSIFWNITVAMLATVAVLAVGYHSFEVNPSGEVGIIVLSLAALAGSVWLAFCLGVLKRIGPVRTLALAAIAFAVASFVLITLFTPSAAFTLAGAILHIAIIAAAVAYLFAAIVMVVAVNKSAEQADLPLARVWRMCVTEVAFLIAALTLIPESLWWSMGVIAVGIAVVGACGFAPAPLGFLYRFHRQENGA